MQAVHAAVRSPWSPGRHSTPQPPPRPDDAYVPSTEPEPHRPGKWKIAALLGLSAVTVLVGGNLAILGAHHAMQSPPALAMIHGISNAHAVDGQVWRGSAPSNLNEYRQLASQGVTTIVDLRAEHNVRVDEAALRDMGLTRISIPIRDGQPPSQADVEQFLDIVRNSPGKVFVHCGAGVGRTGSMVAAYRVSEGVSNADALREMLSVGPPSLEQIAFVEGLSPGGYDKPNALITGLSRVLDSPRRALSYLK